MPVFFAFQPVQNSKKSFLVSFETEKYVYSLPIQINLQFEWNLMNIQFEKCDVNWFIFYKTYDIYHAVNWLTQLNSNL